MFTGLLTFVYLPLYLKHKLLNHMGIFDNITKKAEESAKAELEKLLLDNENITFFSLAKEDYCALTNRRLLFVDKSFSSSKKATTGVPFTKISSVSIKKGGAFSITKEIIITVGSKDIEIEMYDETKSVELFKLISERIG